MSAAPSQSLLRSGSGTVVSASMSHSKVGSGRSIAITRK